MLHPVSSNSLPRISWAQAQHLYLKNVHYLVKEGEALIVDESTGRATKARWSEGLHQVCVTGSVFAQFLRQTHNALDVWLFTLIT